MKATSSAIYEWVTVCVTCICFSSKVINYNYLYAINAWLLIVPQWLCFDWSMGCMPLIKSFFDLRMLCVAGMWTVLLALLAYCVRGKSLQIKRYGSVVIILRFIVPRLVHYFSLYVNLGLERFQSSVVKLKVTPSLWPIAEDIDNPLNQSKLKDKIRCSWREAHENMCDWVTIFFRAFFRAIV